MHKKFDHTEIEEKWQHRWRETHLYDVLERDPAREKKYILVEFPYPSGNLHIGHWFAFSVVDIYARFLRMQGNQVFFPIGFDSFGLPAENAAIKRKLDPKQWTEDNISQMLRQLESMGNSFSWNALLRTSDPEYYRWTQLMFTEFFTHDIAYRGEADVNWCPSCNTVLANEQVVAGACERCGTEVTQKRMRQWMMRITNYADRLIDDLDQLPWPEHIKDSQRNWIGRSEGSEITFPLSTGDSLSIFTTRPDTLFGATYVVIAPEHAVLEKLLPHVKNIADVESYRHAALNKKEIERIAVSKEKTGIKLEGVHALHPVSQEPLPVFVADYVLAGYGTGAIMAVPAHDERDFAFATKYNIPIVQVIETSEPLPYRGEGVLINSGPFNGLSIKQAQEAITAHVGGKRTKTYKLRDWSVGRQRYWGVPIPIVYDPAGHPHPIPKEHLPWLLPADVDFTPTGEPPLAKSVELFERTERIFGKGWKPEVETMDTFVDSSWYFLRYLDPHNATTCAPLDLQKAWMPVDLYFGGAEHTTMHLLYSRFWQKALFDLGYATTSEPYTRRINRGLVLGPDGNKMSKSKGNVVDPDEQVRRMGADTVKMYLAFMGPYGEPSNYPWDMGGITGLRRFLERVCGLDSRCVDTEQKGVTSLLHHTIEKVRADISVYKFNTAISALMIFLNLAEKNGLSKNSYQIFLKLLAPFAPHLCEELWERLGETRSIHTEIFPVADQHFLTAEEATIAVQFNGKTRGTITVAFNSEEHAVKAILLSDPAFVQYSEKVKSARTIFVKNRVINLVG